jgi:WD40 repeat protein
MDGLVKLWHVNPGLEGNALAGNPGWLQGVVLSPDGRRLASVTTDSFAVDLYDLPKRSRALLSGHTGTVMSAAFSPDGRILATGSHDQTVRLWDVSNHKAVATLTNGFPVRSLAFSPDGRTLIVSGSSWYFLEGDRAGLQFWDVPSRQATGSIPGAPSDIVELALSASGSLLATGHKEGAVSLWDAQTRRLLHQFKSQFGNQVISLAFSPTEPLCSQVSGIGSIEFSRLR